MIQSAGSYKPGLCFRFLHDIIRAIIVHRSDYRVFFCDILMIKKFVNCRLGEKYPGLLLYVYSHTVLGYFLPNCFNHKYVYRSLKLVSTACLQSVYRKRKKTHLEHFMILGTFLKFVSERCNEE